MKHILIGFLILYCLVIGTGTAYCETPVISLLAQATGGLYSGSVERKSYMSEKGALSFTPYDEFGVTLFGGTETLYRKEPLEKLTLKHGGASFFILSKEEENDYTGFTATAIRINGDDSDSDGMAVVYGSLYWGFPFANLYLDAGYAKSPYQSVTANQYTATVGFTLFHPSLYARTRGYLIDLSKPVEGFSQTMAVEQKLFWYAVPGSLTFTFTGLLGKRIHAYDPDIRTAYTVPDIQGKSAGITASWTPYPSLSLFMDTTAESYDKPSINNAYRVVYMTLGFNLSF